MKALSDLTPAELGEIRARERDCTSFLAWRDGGGTLRLLELDGRDRVSVGRSLQSEISLPWDSSVSRAHALLEAVGDSWTLLDDGISRNGSSVNGVRVTGRRRLRDGDVLSFGGTRVCFRVPSALLPPDPSAETSGITGSAVDFELLRPAQKRVLIALCAPLIDSGPGALAASNQEIADRLSISIDGVRTQMRTLYDRLDVAEMPQARKRSELARRALEAGLVTRADLSS